MALIIETVVLCALFFLLCFLGTGSDQKNLKYYESYPDEVQAEIMNISEYRNQVKERSRISALVGNFIIFSIVIFVAGIFVRNNSFLHNFIYLSIIGEVINAFDLLIIDLVWWRNSPRIRFEKIPEKALYSSPKKHVAAFLRGIVLFEVVAAVVGYLLTLF